MTAARSEGGLRTGVDLGGTKIAAVVLGARGRPLAEHRIPSPRHDYGATIRALGDIVRLVEEGTGGRGSLGIERDGVPVAQREGRGHGRVRVEDPAHRGVVEGPAQPEQARALGDDRPTGGGEGGHRPAQRLVGGELRRVHLGKPAADHQPARPGRKFLLAQRVDDDHLGAGRREQFGRLGVREGEGRPAGQRDHRRRPGGRRGWAAGGGEGRGRAPRFDPQGRD